MSQIQAKYKFEKLPLREHPSSLLMIEATGVAVNFCVHSLWNLGGEFVVVLNVPWRSYKVLLTNLRGIEMHQMQENIC